MKKKYHEEYGLILEGIDNNTENIERYFCGIFLG